MELDEFTNHLASVFEAPETITPETRYRDHEEWCSIVALSVMAVVRKRCKVTLKAEELRSCSTVEDLFQKVKERM